MSQYALQLIVPETHFKSAKASALTSSKASTSDRGQRTVRRPTRGIVLKDDTFATLRVVAGSGGNVKLVDAGSRRKEASGPNKGSFMEVDGKRATDVYSNFLLQSVIEDRQEKQQILETFGEPYIFFFGQRARVMGFQGILANTFDFNWEAEWWWNYDQYLRGTKCVENDARVFLSFDNTLVGGYLLSCNSQKNAPERNWVQFQFQLFVTDYENFSDLGNPFAVPGVSAEYEDLSSQLTKQYSAADLAPFAPQKIIPTGLGQRLLVDSTGNVTVEDLGDEALARSFQDFESTSPSSLAQAWQDVQAATNSVIDTAAQVLSGAVVRVPSGFAGAFSYDDQDELNSILDQSKLNTGGVVTFSTFADNDDEFVGSSDHYGSALVQFSAYSDLLTEFKEGQKVSDQARSFWEEAGLKPESDLLSNLAQAVQYAKLGVIAIGVGQGVASYKPSQSVPDFTNGLSQMLGGGALPHYNTDNTYPE